MPLEQLNDDQMKILLDFADRCRHLCFGRPPSGTENEIIAYKEWKDFSRDMNYAGEGDCKSGIEWKAYWTELKRRTKAKVALAKRKSKFNGYTSPKLTPYESRLMELAEIASREAKQKQKSTNNNTIDTTEDLANSSENAIKPVDVTNQLRPNTALAFTDVSTTQIGLSPEQTMPRVMLTPLFSKRCLLDKANRLSDALRELANSQKEVASSQAELAKAQMAMAQSNQAVAEALRLLSGKANN